MRVADLNWMQVTSHLERDDRAVLPVGSTEQHAYLSLCTDSLLAERVAVEAAEPLGVPVFPALPYGITPAFMAYPGTVSLSVESFTRVIEEILDSLATGGFRRILIVNGHGGNTPLAGLAAEWMSAHPGTRVKLHDWWKSPGTWAKVRAIDLAASHASWMESFQWTRVAGVASPRTSKPMIDPARLRSLSPDEVREILGDGSFGGLYQRADHEMDELWAVAVDETRSQLEGGWA